jgi:hypothetical protein
MPHRTRSKTRPPSSSSSSAINIEVTERSESKDETPLSNQVERPEGLDKENVKKSAFQPPSPLTSRRSKQKLSTSKKVLSPNRNNQWTRDRESTNTSRQPRSSPIHGRQSFSQVSYHIGAMFLGAPFFLARNAHLRYNHYFVELVDFILVTNRIDSRPVCQLRIPRFSRQLDCSTL